jgi:hypothetical protein
MFFLRARHILPLHLPRFGGFLFASVPESKNPAFPTGRTGLLLRTAGLPIWPPAFPHPHSQVSDALLPRPHPAGLF